ncbi:unnamed protein product [Microthlaspi erraticum]|uniref:BHLH domain-containing protein n=1 Tax=Microthlaspi erraticum TaxID=1685480 RepID=A0A6D2KH25_9BRAS|nr:unnamed protein product [Microthlaspi erraticum]
MSSQPNHQTSTSSLLHDRLHIPAETITAKEPEDTCQTQRKGKRAVLYEHDLKDDQDHGSSGSKKQDHNAKERLRRMRLHASYLTLGTLLPDHSSSSKKKWCAPSIIDRVVTYIPNLQNEVVELTLRKQELVDAMESKKSRELEQRSPSIRTISVHELEGSGNEAVVQICTKKEKAEEFSNLLHVMEVQGFSILNASTTQVCRDQKVVSYHFHVKMDERPSGGDDYITMLKKNIISSLS